MKILAFTDNHNSQRSLDKIRETFTAKNPDILICAGDFTVFGHGIEQMLAAFDSFGKLVLVIHGNHEENADMRSLCKRCKNIIFLHEGHYVVGDTVFFGHGGGGFSFSDKELAARAPAFEKLIAAHKNAIFVTHAPPHNTALDLVHGSHVGCKTTTQFIMKNTQKIKLVIVGHIHETFGRQDQLGETVMINPGPYGAMIEIE